MHRHLLLALSSFILCSTLRAEDSFKPAAFAENGGVAIDSINIVRTQSADVAKASDPSSMTLDLWLTQAAEMNKSNRIYTIKVELENVEDDTGKLLSSDARREAMSFLKTPSKTSRHKTADGKTGPIVALTLDIPAKGAKTLKSLKGKADVAVAERLKFDDFSSVQDKPLEHEQLKEFPIQPSVKSEKGQTIVTLHVPTEHSRLETWGVGKNDRLLKPISESASESRDGTALVKTYKGDITQGTFLGIVLGEPSKTARYNLEFNDVELP